MEGAVFITDYLVRSVGGAVSDVCRLNGLRVVNGHVGATAGQLHGVVWCGLVQFLPGGMAALRQLVVVIAIEFNPLARLLAGSLLADQLLDVGDRVDPGVSHVDDAVVQQTVH